MAKRIGVLVPEQRASESPRFFEKKSEVRRWIRQAEAVWIVRGQLVQVLTLKACAKVQAAIGSSSSYFDGPLGVGNVLPFARLKNQGDKLHYETPMAGDRTVFARHRRRRIHVSSRSYFSRQAIPA